MAERGADGKDADVLAFLKANSLSSNHLVSHLVLGLTSDRLHFLYEALRWFGPMLGCDPLVRHALSVRPRPACDRIAQKREQQPRATVVACGADRHVG
jgi:hypothetical protein